ncbi:MAG TPA: hypothetical protein VJZ16_01400 [Syntrophales bacterium]|nr:hypothetical protein [Syntrophales bacterium]
MNRLRWALLGIVAIISLLGGLAMPHDPVHEAWWNRIPGFFALFGFFGCLLIVVFAKLLGKFLLQKKEDYYDAD